MPVYMVIAAIYVVINLLLTAAANWVQKRFVGEKKLQVAMVGEKSAAATKV